MDINDPQQGRFALVKEMLQTSEVIRKMDWAGATEFAKDVNDKNNMFMTGEGSSRIMPAHHVMSLARRRGLDLQMGSDGSRQAMEYDLSDAVVFGASNSGKTREVIELFRQLKAAGHDGLFALTATPESPLEKEADDTFVLNCGKEEAVAATKSVVEQTLFYHIILDALCGKTDWPGTLAELSDKTEQVLTAGVDSDIAKTIASAGTICFAGRNDGAAEELALKTCEITRKKGIYCEGTYIVHGIEEVLEPADAVILIEPWEAEYDKYRQVLTEGVGLYVAAISSKPTPFPTLMIPSMNSFDTILQLCAGWNLLVAAGIHLGIDLDTPQRARKVGNELVE